MNTTEFSAFFTKMRKKRNLTQKEIGEALFVTDMAVSKWERGLSLPDTSLFPQLSVLLGTTLSELFGAVTDDSVSSCREDDVQADIQNEDFCVPVAFRESKNIVSPLLFGSNLEHTRGAVNGGLSAEMIKNRKFAGKPNKRGVANCWYEIGEKPYYSTRPYFEADYSYTRHVEPQKMKRGNELASQRIQNIFGGEIGIGQGDIFLKKEAYDFEIAVSAASDLRLKVRFTDTRGEEVLAETVFEVVGSGEWTEYKCTFTPTKSCDDAQLHITYEEKASIYIGAVSLMPSDNFHGMRTDAVAALKKAGVTLLRWPGGNFAGEYRWIDGLLPRNQRGPLQAYTEIETQPWTAGYDFHEINTDDFIALCREVNAIPFITINAAWDSPEDCANWVEYCNGGADTKYGKLRMERGYTEPYNVMLWSLGNEVGFGHMEGANSPSDYSVIVRKCAEAMQRVTPNLTFVSSGNFPAVKWFKYSAQPLKDIAPLFSYHHYCLSMMMDDTKREADFNNPVEVKKGYERSINDVYGTVALFKDIQKHMGDLKICFDEWNAWYAWYRIPGVTEAMYAAKLLHMMMTEADNLQIFMACYFQMLNEGGITIEKEGVSFTPLGKIWLAMRPHVNGKIIYLDKFYSCIATAHDEHVYITLVNDSFDQEKRFVFDRSIAFESATLLSSESVLPYSDFIESNLSLQEEGNEWIATLPPHGVAMLKIRNSSLL